jgi:metal-sulfur cluster biosynthetic enzyme
MKSSNALKEIILERLTKVIDPETGIDVVRMQLVQTLTVDEDGNVSYQFRPSSPLCPIAVPLVVSILEAIQEIQGVRKQDIEVVDYIQADELNRMLKSILPPPRPTSKGKQHQDFDHV